MLYSVLLAYLMVWCRPPKAGFHLQITQPKYFVMMAMEVVKVIVFTNILWNQRKQKEEMTKGIMCY